MNYFSKTGRYTLGILACILMATPAAAQEFSSSQGFTDYVRRTCGALAGAGAGGRDTVQEDLFRRCNGALNAPSSETGGLTGQGDILDQYIGAQNLAPQSDGFSRAQRPDSFVSARLDVIANQMRGGQFASLMPQRPILLASNDDSIPLSGGVSRTGRWDGFASLGFFQTDQDTSGDELGYDQDGFWIAGGMDYSFSDNLIAGAALSYVDASADFNSVGGLSSGGETGTENWSVSVYGSYLATDALELNGLVAFGQADFDTERDISIVDKNGGGINDPADGNFATVQRTATSSSSADTAQISLGASYGYYFDSGVSLTPTANVSYYHAKVDGFTETGSNGLDLIFEDQEVNSTQLAIGATLARGVSMDWGVFVPYGRATAVFELQDSEQSVTARYAAALDPNDQFTVRTSPADESVIDLAVGASTQFASGLAAFAEYSTVLGLDNVDHQAISLGLRYEF